MKNTLLLQVSSPPNESSTLKYLITHDLAAKQTFSSRVLCPDIEPRVTAFKEQIHTVLKATDDTYSKKMATLERVLRTNGVDLADALLNDEAKNTLSNFMNGDSVLALGDERSGELPWELLALKFKDGDVRQVCQKMLVTRVCQQVAMNPLELNVLSKEECAAWTASRVEGATQYRDRLRKCGFKEITKLQHIDKEMKSVRGVAIIARSTFTRAASAVKASDRSKSGLHLGGPGEIYSYIDVVGNPLPQESIVFLFSCNTSGSQFAQEIVRASKATVIASDYELPAEGCARIASKLAMWLRNLSDEIEFGKFWLSVFQPLSPLCNLFAVHGKWRATLRPKGDK